MIQQLKDTRHGSPAQCGEDYVDQNGILRNDSCHKEWDKILDKMIFLFREADESTCRKKNPYEEEYQKASSEFSEKYGFWGEKLRTENEKGKPYGTIHFMNELPEYQEIHQKFMDEDKHLYEYRCQCKDQAFELFARWFWALWD
ncbi:MAG: hypothetical protein LUE92_00165 [Clostridiales bacterium]|nr:hypothetical protein [Clostridiales bacterium]